MDFLQSDWFAIVATVCGWASVAASLYAFWSKTIMPLRWAIMAASVLAIVWSLYSDNLPFLVLHCLLLPLNVLRLREMQKLIEESGRANRAPADFEWLKPFMVQLEFKAGDTIFNRGDLADAAFVIGDGQVALTELGIILGPGSMMGEMGLFTSSNKRMSGARCMSDVQIWRITYAEFEQLYFQNPQFGFNIVRMMVRRMENNLNRFSGGRPPAGGGAAPAPGASG